MPQIFPRWFDTVARAGIVGGVLLVPATAVGLAILYHSDYVTRARTGYEQPVPFSHEHHVGRLGIDCRYCHESASHSAFAGMPATETCMNCHQQIWVGADTLAPVRQSWKTGIPIHWRRVHNLPGFVYFAHNVHVSKGVGCVECHGRLDRMPLTWQVQPLTMAWCLECHRDPTRHLRPEDEVFNMTWTAADQAKAGSSAGNPAERAELSQRLKEHFQIKDTRTLTSCSTCHR